MNYTLNQLESAGGKLWEKNGMRRVYFNSLSDRIGLSVSRYKTGNISSASLGDESISNSRARRIISNLEYGKIYYDLNDSKFYTKNLGEYENSILESVKNDIQNVVDAESTPVKNENTHENDETAGGNGTDSTPEKFATTDKIEYLAGYGSIGSCWCDCGDRLNEFLNRAAEYTKQTVSDVWTALHAGKRVIFDYDSETGKYEIRNATVEKRIVCDAI